MHLDGVFIFGITLTFKFQMIFKSILNFGVDQCIRQSIHIGKKVDKKFKTSFHVFVVYNYIFKFLSKKDLNSEKS